MPDLEILLDRSLADEAFKVAVREYARHHATERIAVARHAPRVKVLRVLSQLLHAARELPIERVRLDASSGCCDFRGTLEVEVAGDVHVYEFVWDCRWRAQEEGWLDRWGAPDQSRAAHEFGWRCFRTWHRGVRAGAEGATG